MEWTAQSIRAIEFREKLRGYHPDDVDAFVERVAVAFEQLQDAVTQARAAPGAAVIATAPSPPEAEQAMQPSASGETISEETIRRTLVMAQRTADMVLSEAQESASSLVAQAQAEAKALLADANQRSEHLAVDAHERLTAEVADLEATRAQLEQDVAALEDYVASQRQRLRDLLVQQLENLDEDTMALQQAPAVHEVGDEALTGASPSSISADEATQVDAEDDIGDEWVNTSPAFDSLTAEAEDDPIVADEVVMGADAAVIGMADQPRSRRDEFHLPGEGEDDPFLAELRRAIEDPDYPGPESEPAAEALVPPVRVADDDPVTSATSSGDLRGMPEGGRLSGRLFRRK